MTVLALLLPAGAGLAVEAEDERQLCVAFRRGPVDDEAAGASSRPMDDEATATSSRPVGGAAAATSSRPVGGAAATSSLAFC